MGKTTNILDLNNRLEKVEKEHVAQNNYNSLKNRPKINGNLLTGDKTGAQLGLAEAQDITEINEKLADTGWIQIETTGIYYRKNGNVVSVKGILRNSQDSEWTTKATLPLGFRPYLHSFYRCILFDSTTSFRNLYISTNGEVKVRGNADVEFEELFLTE